MTQATRELRTLACRSCGGSLVYDIGREATRCAFCDSVALAAEPNEVAPIPDAEAPFVVSHDEAVLRFRKWAGGSWWYPRELRSLAVEVRPIRLPVWRVAGEVETHWAGLERAATRSGRRPVSGVESHVVVELVPASQGIRADELAALGPYTTQATPAPGDAHHDGIPYEVPRLSRTAALPLAHGRMADRERQRIEAERRLERCRASAIVTDREVRLEMVPVHVGAFRYRGRPWRFLVNGQTGACVGDAPIDRVRVAIVVAAAVIAIGLVAVAVGS